MLLFVKGGLRAPNCKGPHFQVQLYYPAAQPILSIPQQKNVGYPIPNNHRTTTLWRFFSLGLINFPSFLLDSIRRFFIPSFDRFFSVTIHPFGPFHNPQRHSLSIPIVNPLLIAQKSILLWLLAIWHWIETVICLYFPFWFLISYCLIIRLYNWGFGVMCYVVKC